MAASVSALTPTHTPTTTRVKRGVTESTKKIVASRQKWTCAHCHTLLDFTFEVDHVLALYRGGSNDLDNLEALCPNCHRRKTTFEAREESESKRAEKQVSGLGGLQPGAPGPRTPGGCGGFPPSITPRY
jgi:5-methylcytosine-specific restriction endonuclease McrA